MENNYEKIEDYYIHNNGIDRINIPRPITSTHTEEYKLRVINE